MTNRIVSRNRAVFSKLPKAVPSGNVDVSGGGRWRIWQDAGTKIDAPVLGNGRMLSAFVAIPKWPQFWITTNDFWQMESAANWEFFHDNDEAKHDPPMSLGSPRPIGRMVFDIPALSDAKVSVSQEFETATTIAEYLLLDNQKVYIKSYVAATEDTMIIEFQSDIDMDVEFDFYFPDEIGKGCDKAVDIWGSGESDEKLNGMFVGMIGGKALQYLKSRDGIVSGYREFSDNVDIPVKAAFAGCFVTDKEGERGPKGKENKKEIKKGEKAFFVIPTRTWAKCSRPYEYALSRAKWINKNHIDELRKEHLMWWNFYWNTSEIELDDPVIEQRYYLSKYMLGSVSGDPDYPPNILGISTFDRMAWNGNYKINYNHQTPYMNLYVSGHFIQADPHDKPYLDLLDITREMSNRLLKHDGAYYPLGLGPHGMVSEALLLYMKSPAVHGAMNMISRYRLTQDKEYGKRIYPFLISIADFWEKDLVLRDGKYHVVGDGMHERITKNIIDEGMPEDPVNTLGYLRSFFDFMPEISRDLSINEDRIPAWENIRKNLAPFPVGTIRQIKENPTLWKEASAEFSELLPDEMLDLPIYYDEGKGGKWSFHFPGNVMQIYPASAIGLSSDEEERQIAYNTVLIHDYIEDALAEKLYKDDLSLGKVRDDRHFYKAGAWNSTNLSCLFFPAAARIGYDPEKIIKEMTLMIEHRGLPNGFLKENPHGIEELNTVPDTIQEMMLQSYDGTIRVFPVWPKDSHKNASFRSLYACGAFKVSAILKEGEVDLVEILSINGNKLKLYNPWNEGAFRVEHVESGRVEEFRDEIICIPTNKMESIIIRKS